MFYLLITSADNKNESQTLVKKKKHEGLFQIVSFIHVWRDLGTSDLGMKWLGYEVAWVRIDLGTKWLGYEVTWVRSCLGTK